MDPDPLRTHLVTFVCLEHRQLESCLSSWQTQHSVEPEPLSILYRVASTSFSLVCHPQQTSVIDYRIPPHQSRTPDSIQLLSIMQNRINLLPHPDLIPMALVPVRAPVDRQAGV